MFWDKFNLFHRAASPAAVEFRPEPGRDLPIGLVAGRGEYPLEFCRAARRAGVSRLAVAALIDEATPDITALADQVEWVHVGQIKKTIDVFRRQEIHRVVFAGQIKPSRLYGGIRPDFRALKLLFKLKERNAHTIFGAVADEFEREGVQVLPAYTYLESWLAQPGTLGRIQPGSGIRDDMAFGIRIAREISRLEIGQTVVVKRGTVLAVEGFEGTDQAIRRGGELGQGRVTVVKLAKPTHDMRFDVPCIGLNTVDSLIAARAVVLAVEAGRTLLLQRDAVLERCDRAGIAVVGFTADAV